MIGQCQGMTRIGKKHYERCRKLGTIDISGKPYCEACARREAARINLELVQLRQQRERIEAGDGPMQRALFDPA